MAFVPSTHADVGAPRLLAIEPDKPCTKDRRAFRVKRSFLSATSGGLRGAVEFSSPGLQDRNVSVTRLHLYDRPLIRVPLIHALFMSELEQAHCLFD